MAVKNEIGVVQPLPSCPFCPTRLPPSLLQVSVMAVNNEIGVVQPLADIGALCREKKVFFHTDAAQVGMVPAA